MILSIGRTTDDKRTLNKNFYIEKTINAELKENTNVINPIFIVSTDDFFKINYLYCPSFNRYYYIKNINNLTGNRQALECEVDVLMSYKSEIKALNGTIERQEFLYNDFIVDTNVQTRCDRYINQHKIGELSGNGIYITVNAG